MPLRPEQEQKIKKECWDYFEGELNSKELTEDFKIRFRTLIDVLCQNLFYLDPYSLCWDDLQDFVQHKFNAFLRLFNKKKKELFQFIKKPEGITPQDTFKILLRDRKYPIIKELVENIFDHISDQIINWDAREDGDSLEFYYDVIMRHIKQHLNNTIFGYGFIDFLEENTTAGVTEKLLVLIGYIHTRTYQRVPCIPFSAREEESLKQLCMQPRLIKHLHKNVFYKLEAKNGRWLRHIISHYIGHSIAQYNISYLGIFYRYWYEKVYMKQIYQEIEALKIGVKAEAKGSQTSEN